MFALAVAVATAPFLIAIYAYVAYPLALWVIGRRRAPAAAKSGPWPSVTITVPVYNSEKSIRRTLTHLLELDYPRDRLQVLVLSDASTDATDEIVRQFAPHGVELLRAPSRRGKTAAENAAVSVARGEIIVNVDATISVPPQSLKALVAVFDDPTVGVASCRDTSTGAEGSAIVAESGYVGYEMWLRDLETRAGSIVGASGCFYGIRRDIRSEALPPGLSWDFASTLVAKEQGYRSVSVPDATCFVPRAADVRVELRRKSRTMARGVSTLFHFASLMNPFRYGGFAIMLISHKLLRWLPFLIAPAAITALGFLAFQSEVAAIAFTIFAVGVLVGTSTILFPRVSSFRPAAFAGFAVTAAAAGFLAWFDAIRGAHMVTWDPTTRPGISSAKVG